MNKALRYFNGEKRFYIPFFILFGLLAVMCLFEFREYLYPYGFLYIIARLLTVLSVVFLWLRVNSKLTIISSAASALLYVIYYIWLISYGIYWSHGAAFYVATAILSCLACPLGVFLLWLKARKNIKILLLIIDVVPVVLSGIVASFVYIGWGGFLFSFMRYFLFTPQPYLAAAFIFLWLPPEQYSVCPKCGYNNTKTAGFCGGCGLKLN